MLGIVKLRKYRKIADEFQGYLEVLSHAYGLYKDEL